MGAAKLLYGYETVAAEWIPMLVDATGRLRVTGAGGVSSGATFPVAPNTGDFFLHVVAGRKILYEWDGANWQPIISYGSMAVYVDKTDGTDDLLHGTGVDAAAFKTIQYAVDCIPGMYGGNVVIHINGEAYSGTVVVKGKTPTGNFTITLQGALTTLSADTATSKIQGTGATQGSLTKVGAFGAYDNKLLYIATENVYRIIDSDTADVATIVGCFTDAANKVYKIYGWATTLDAIYIGEGQGGVVCEFMALLGPVALAYSWAEVWPGARITFRYCSLTGRLFTSAAGTMTGKGASATILTCFLSAGATVRVLQSSCDFYIERSKLLATAGTIIAATMMSYLFITLGTILDCTSKPAGSIGLDVIANAFTSLYSAAADGYCRIRNCNYGITAATGGIVIDTANIQYFNNTTNESATAASYGYID